MSETAHDLRSPLTTVRESIRIVHDGDLGEVNADQRSCLGSAIDQCGCMEQMIGEMVQLERLRTGTPRVNRHWVGVPEVRRAVDETLRPWAMPRKIDVLWDGADDPRAKVFADTAMLRRLIVNLVTNAIRVTAEGGVILIRLERVRGNEAICWSVVDRGCGISPADMYRIADRQVSFGGGEGLGLSICRQLAAVHFSSLQIRSRLGKATAVSFETAAAGPRSVAQAWSRWRVAYRGPLKMPQHRDQPAVGLTSDPPNRSIRLDPPSVSIELSHDATMPRCADRLTAGIVSLGATVPRRAADKFDELFQAQLQMFDFAYRVDTRRWVWALDTDAHEVQDRIGSITDAAAARIPDVRTRWSEPQMIPIETRRTHWSLSDLLIRETLSASTTSRGLDKNEVRPGTSPLAPSDVAAERLDEEIRRLTRHFRSQTTKLQQQAKSLRPQV
jgi:anti-sigma regulatory factor (Ser/Thr protein kinase)